MATNQSKPTTTALTQAFGPLPPAIDYMIDAAQRTVLFWDVLRERGNQYREQAAKLAAARPELRVRSYHRRSHP